ncbi:hypothetical protein RLOC_00001551 [Lonchura striata]|uniref:Uncharacterized protein n=1 Tax=Lonchura striata TaxID=40157 RepID=A0A218UKQ3_9PASE|nr:hypothetical protein RLOC_00001551 [Lonchura striata domestica]
MFGGLGTRRDRTHRHTSASRWGSPCSGAAPRRRGRGRLPVSHSAASRPAPGRRIKRRGPERRRPVPEPRALQPLRSPAWTLLLCWGLAACCTGAMALQPPSITILRMPAELPRPGTSWGDL